MPDLQRIAARRRSAYDAGVTCPDDAPSVGAGGQPGESAMKRAVASSASAIAILLVGIGAAWGTGILAASGGRQEQPAEPATERVQLEVVVTETNRDSGTAVGTSEGRRTWHVRAMTAAGNRVSVSGEAVHVEATPSLRGDGLFAVSLSVLAQRRNWSDGPDTAINARLDVVLDDGVPTIVAEASNPANDGVVAVEVTATLLDRPADRRADQGRWRRAPARTPSHPSRADPGGRRRAPAGEPGRGLAAPAGSGPTGSDRSTRSGRAGGAGAEPGPLIAGDVVSTLSPAGDRERRTPESERRASPARTRTHVP